MLTKKITLIIFTFFLLAATVTASVKLDNLQENQIVQGFKTVSLYENAAGKPMGARFVSVRFGFIIDYLQIESVPQAFFWVKTPPSSSKGEPHSCEHLLLGKGNRGRYVAALEDMALSNSTAYTAQTRTCYHFNTIAGGDTFYKIFEAKLQALLHPDFTDEEIRREVCFIGVNVDSETGELSIDEKGTYYTEMVSTFEKPWYYSYGTMNKLMYGENHPLVNNSGGAPDVMRTMEPKDMWAFHKKTHHLANLGSIVSMPTSVELESFLTTMNSMLENCQTYDDPNNNPSIKVQNLPPANSAPIGTATMAYYPSENEEDPGYIMYAWPPLLQLDDKEEMLFSLFLETFASGQTSNLYNLFINSETKQIDIGGNYIFATYDNDLDIAPYFVFGGINKDAITLEKMQSIKTMILDELKKVQSFTDGSAELIEFNDRLKSRLVQNKKQIEDYLNSPPMFGFRGGSAGGWVSLLLDVEKQPTFKKSLVMANTYTSVETELTKPNNIWTERIDRWKFLTVDPYSIGTVPSSSILEKNKTDKEQRLANYIEEYKIKYGVDDTQLALAKYKEEFDAKTAELEKINSNNKLPGFISNPPLTLDDQLNYETIQLLDNIKMTASTFDNMSSSTVALALRLDVIPESLLVYAPLIPDMLTSIGVLKDGEVVPYDKMSDRLKNEVLGLNASYDFGLETGRIELILSGRGSNLTELHNAIDWMDASLFTSYLSVDNLSRISDVIDQSLISYRNRVKRSEENWVRNPSNAYRFQNNPLYLSTNSFLTETHHLSRLKWMFTNPGSESEQQALKSKINLLRNSGKGKNREELLTLLDNKQSIKSAELPENPVKIFKDIRNSLKTTLADIPDANLADDWIYLCSEIKNDLLKKPEIALAEMKYIISLLSKRDNARMYMVSNKTDRNASIDKINKLLSKLDNSSPSVRQSYSNLNTIVERLKSRESLTEKPVYAGLIFNGTRNGVLMFSAKNSEKFDTSEDALLQTLSSKLYAGYGPHGLFMKTWAAGLAYSNGYRMSEQTGRAAYYAERCPDVAETMRFVVNLLKNADDNPDLADYTVAQIFGSSRASNRYEQRGKSIAADFADGVLPEKVTSYRQHILKTRQKDNFYSLIKNRMEDAYGSVLIGYGKPLSESKEGNFFLIGPEPQFESLEKYIKQTEGEQTVYRLYPRDFWLTN